MKNGDIEILGKTASLLGKYLPVEEHELYQAYLLVCERLRAKNDQEKQDYQDKAEYYRETSKKWRQDNKERSKEYQKQWLQKRKLKGKTDSEDNG